LTALALALPAAAQPQTGDPVLAVVNGAPIKRSELEAAQQTLPEQYREMPLEMIYDPLLDRLIDSRLLSAEAEKRKLGEDPKVQAEIERARDGVLRDSLVQRTIDEGTTVEKLQAAYNAQRNQPGFAAEEVHARHVLVADEAAARAVLKELEGGADFAAVAKAKSTDPSAQSNGGDLGYFKREAMVPEFAEAAFTIPPGTVGKDPVKSQFGWHVIKVEDRRQSVPSFEEKEPELREQVARDIVESMVADIRGAAEIERFNIDGTPRTEAPAPAPTSP
jgi:peptidyl-prolyl cis-trans isomerase C